MIDKRKMNLATDSLILTLVQCITLGTSMVQTMILSRALSKLEYGTYSQGLLIVNSVSPFLLLGLANAINYFFNQNESGDIVKKYINTIFGLVFYSGFSAGIVFFIVRQWMCQYFRNDLLVPIIPLIAFRPLLENIISLYHPLFISGNLSKLIALRNLAVGILKVLIVWITVVFSRDIRVIFALTLLMDVIQVVLFKKTYEYYKDKVSYFRIYKETIARILKYALPLALSTMVGTLSINMDKLIVGRMLSTEEFAMYSNMAKELPFSFIVSSLTTVVTPVLIQFKSLGKMDEVKKLWKRYIETGSTVTWILTTGAIICSRELVIFLYSDKYVDGILIFFIYLVVTMTRITYFGMVLTLFEKTKHILYYSCLALSVNAILNYLLILKIGIIGPAIATLVSTILMNGLQLRKGMNLLEIHFLEVFDIKILIPLMGKLIFAAMLVYMIKDKFDFFNMNNTVKLVTSYILFVGTMFLLEKRRLGLLFKGLNNVSILDV